MTPIIIIDPGHGGRAARGSSSPLGVRGPAGALEKDVVFELARRVAARLGPGAILTRTGDTNLSLAERAQAAARYGAAVFLSLHANAGAPGQRGAETYVHPRAGESSRALAHAVQRELGAFGGASGAVGEGELAVLAPDRLGARTAACLVEADYLTSSEGERRLTDERSLDAMGGAIARGVHDYLRAATYGQQGIGHELPQIPGSARQTGSSQTLTTGSINPTSGNASLRGPTIYFAFQQIGVDPNWDDQRVEITLNDSAGNGPVAFYSLRITDGEWHNVEF
jgi:N-acetylmuramoyl-L-alanine amidase